MISRTIETELDNYRIGEKVRELRKLRELKLVELGDHTGLSTAMLSKIERGKVVPTLPTLTRIALAFSVGLEYFFSPDESRHAFGVTRASERLRMPSNESHQYDFENLDYTVHEPKLKAYLAHFKSTKTSPAHKHPGIEFIFVTEGELELNWKNKSTILHPGDSIYFDATIEHAYRSQSQEGCTGIIVTLPA